jgi:hypothetical protein
VVNLTLLTDGLTARTAAKQTPRLLSVHGS